MKEEIFDKVIEVFREIFDDEDLIITPETNASNIEDWDSYNHINLIVALETRFEVSFTTQEIGSMTCVGDLLVLLGSKSNHS
jgi:acyl carrier protein